jgi:hypothetical protein
MLPTVLGAKMRITFVNAADNRPVELMLNGRFRLRQATIVDASNGDAVVGEVKRESFNAGQLLMGSQTYNLTVPAGVDLALMAAICVGVDEAEEDGKKEGIRKFL